MSLAPTGALRMSTDASPYPPPPPEQRPVPPPEPAPAPATERPPRQRRTPPAVLALIVAASAVAGALSDASPTGHDIGDAFWNGLFAAALSFFTAHARRWAWFILAGAAATLAQGLLALACGVASLVGTFAAGFFAGRRRWMGALVGGLAAQALLRGHTFGFTGLPTIIVAAACFPVFVSGYRLLTRPTRRRVRIAIVVAAVVLIPISIAAAVTGLRAEDQMLDAIDLTDQAVAAAGDGDQDLAQSLLIAAGQELDDVADRFDRPWLQPARLVPVLGQHASAIHGLAETGSGATTAAADAIVELDAEALLDGGRIDVDRVDTLVASLEELFDAVGEAQDELTGIDRTWLIPRASDRIDSFDDELFGRFGDVDTIEDAVGVIPDLLGADGPRSYLVLFMQPSESRGLGGFIGNWAELAIDDGEMTLAASGRGDDLNEALPDGGIAVPGELLELYEGWGLPTKFQNLGVIPDLPTVADLAADFYGSATGRAVDGVITIDHAGMAGLVDLTGPVTVADRTMNGPEVERFVLEGQYIDYDDDTEARLVVLDQLTAAVFDQFVGGELPPPRRMVDVFKPLAQGDHIRLVTFDDAEAEALDGVGLRDAFPRFDGQDLLAVVTQNTGENKIDTFLRRDIEYDATIDPATGDVTARLRIRLTNDAPSSGLPDAILGNNDQQLPLGTNRLRVHVYTPLGVESATLDGVPVDLPADDEFGWSRIRTTVWLDPGQSELLELDLAGRLDLSNGYVLEVEHQPMINPDTVRLELRPAPGATIDQVAGVDTDGRATLVLESDKVMGLTFDD